jgi:hypothetical protein
MKKQERMRLVDFLEAARSGSLRNMLFFKTAPLIYSPTKRMPFRSTKLLNQMSPSFW